MIGKHILCIVSGWCTFEESEWLSRRCTYNVCTCIWFTCIYTCLSCMYIYILFWIEIHINFPLHQRNEMFGNPLQFAEGVDFVICCDGEDSHFNHFQRNAYVWGISRDLNSRNRNKNTYTWSPIDSCFDWKRPSFGGLKPQNRGHLQVQPAIKSWLKTSRTKKRLGSLHGTFYFWTLNPKSETTPR